MKTPFSAEDHANQRLDQANHPLAAPVAIIFAVDRLKISEVLRLYRKFSA